MCSRILPTNASILQRTPREEEPNHLDFIRSLPCVVCMNPGVDPAHIRYADDRYNKRQTGMGEKSDDKWVVPLCRGHHEIQHSVNEQKFWKGKGIDPCAMALVLHSVSPDYELGERVVLAWNGRIKV